MNLQAIGSIASAVFALAALLIGLANNSQNKSIQLAIANLRNQLLEEKISPLSERVTALETEVHRHHPEPNGWDRYHR